MPYGDCVYGEGLYKGELELPDGTTDIFTYEPNWAGGVTMRYRYETVISKTRKLYEQRRMFQPKPLRTERFNVLYEDGRDNKFFNYMKKYHAKQILVPIFTEPCIPVVSTSILGYGLAANPLIIEDAQYCYNLNNQCIAVIIMDISRTYGAEIKLLESVTNAGGQTSLVFSSVIATNFTGNISIVYPLFEALVSSHSVVDYTDAVTEYEVEFSEYHTHSLD